MLLKQATISPIYKGMDKSLPENYRPVALTSHIIKVFEKCVRDKVFTYQDEQGLFASQYELEKEGLPFLNSWDIMTGCWGTWQGARMLTQCPWISPKVFDKVHHGVLPPKIKLLGISGKLRIRVHNFLTRRAQIVTVNGHRSDEVPVSI